MNPYRPTPTPQQVKFIDRNRLALSNLLQKPPFVNRDESIIIEFDEEHQSAQGPVDRFSVHGLERLTPAWSKLQDQGIELNLREETIYVPHRYYHSQQSLLSKCDFTLVLNLFCTMLISIACAGLGLWCFVFQTEERTGGD